MFTGIIQDIGTVVSLVKTGDWVLTIQPRKRSFAYTVLGASIACSGVCLTVVDKSAPGAPGWFAVDVAGDGAVSICTTAEEAVAAVVSFEENLAQANRGFLYIDEVNLLEDHLVDLLIDVAKVNLDGGALALGHPLGATGARITGKAASLLKREGKKFALATQCIGGGQGIATILENVG